MAAQERHRVPLIWAGKHQEELYSLAAAAAKCGLSYVHLRNMVTCGRLQAVHKPILMTCDYWLNEFLASRKMEGRGSGRTKYAKKEGV